MTNRQAVARVYGADVANEWPVSVTTAYNFGHKQPPIPAELDGKLSDYVRKKYSDTWENVRREMSVDNEAMKQDLLKRLTDHLTWRELIHTSYFEIKPIRDLIASAIMAESRSVTDVVKAEAPRNDTYRILVSLKPVDEDLSPKQGIGWPSNSTPKAKYENPVYRFLMRTKDCTRYFSKSIAKLFSSTIIQVRHFLIEKRRQILKIISSPSSILPILKNEIVFSAICGFFLLFAIRSFQFSALISAGFIMAGILAGLNIGNSSRPKLRNFSAAASFVMFLVSGYNYNQAYFERHYERLEQKGAENFRQQFEEAKKIYERKEQEYQRRLENRIEKKIYKYAENSIEDLVLDLPKIENTEILLFDFDRIELIDPEIQTLIVKTDQMEGSQLGALEMSAEPSQRIGRLIVHADSFRQYQNPKIGVMNGEISGRYQSIELSNLLNFGAAIYPSKVDTLYMRCAHHHGDFLLMNSGAKKFYLDKAVFHQLVERNVASRSEKTAGADDGQSTLARLEFPLDTLEIAEEFDATFLMTATPENDIFFLHKEYEDNILPQHEAKRVFEEFLKRIPNGNAVFGKDGWTYSVEAWIKLPMSDGPSNDNCTTITVYSSNRGGGTTSPEDPRFFSVRIVKKPT